MFWLYIYIYVSMFRFPLNKEIKNKQYKDLTYSVHVFQFWILNLMNRQNTRKNILSLKH